jgi:hypothetical protein
MIQTLASGLGSRAHALPGSIPAWLVCPRGLLFGRLVVDFHSPTMPSSSSS